jgi:LacI family transcriptional regulator
LVPACFSGDSVTFLQERKVPVVVLDRRVSDVQVDTLRGDSEEGAYQLTRHLLNLGHTRIAILSGPPSVSTAVDRVAGYRRALAEAGLDSRAELVYHAEYTQAGGYQMALQALAVTPRPTALFAANNFVASGAFRALREAGLRVPEDMSIVSFDDLPTASDMGPSLTVAAQPAYEMGRRATELLLTRLAGEGPAEPQVIVLPAEIIVRGSSAPPPVDSPIVTHP